MRAGRKSISGAKAHVTKALTYLFLIVWSAIALIPIIWCALTSLKTHSEIFSNPVGLPTNPVLSNYIEVLSKTPFAHYFFNSFTVAVITSLIAIALGLESAYVISRFKVGTKNYLFWLLSLRFLPPVVAAIPIYLIIRWLGLLDTLPALIITYLLFNIPFATWLLIGFVSSIPVEVEEAAMIDGCSRAGAFVRIVIPLLRNGILITFLFCFLFSWNEYLFALVLTGSQAKTLPVFVTSFLSIHQIYWGEVAASTMIMILPTLIFGIILAKYLVRGLTLGAVKA